MKQWCSNRAALFTSRLDAAAELVLQYCRLVSELPDKVLVSEAFLLGPVSTSDWVFFIQTSGHPAGNTGDTQSDILPDDSFIVFRFYQAKLLLQQNVDLNNLEDIFPKKIFSCLLLMQKLKTRSLTGSCVLMCTYKKSWLRVGAALTQHRGRVSNQTLQT